jgi:hypothetical protein
MLERDKAKSDEGSGTMLFHLLKSILMILPQSTCYCVLRDRLVSISNFRQSTMIRNLSKSLGHEPFILSSGTKRFVDRTIRIRNLHCRATWQTIRQESLEIKKIAPEYSDGANRRSWLGYSSKEEQLNAERIFRNGIMSNVHVEDTNSGYHDIALVENQIPVNNFLVPNEMKESDGVVVKDDDDDAEGKQWKAFWASADR